MEIKYCVHYLEEVVHKDIPALSSSSKTLIKRAIEERLMVDPVRFGKPLRYSLKGHRRLRVGDYRVVYRIESERSLSSRKKILIVAIKHQRDVYED